MPISLDKLADVRPAKLAALAADLDRVGIDLDLVEEQFVAGGGSGGQKRNKTASCVILRYPPLELVVRCQQERQRSLNRFFALRRLVEAAEKAQGLESERDREAERIRKRKARRKRRSRKKSS